MIGGRGQLGMTVSSTIYRQGAIWGASATLSVSAFAGPIGPGIDFFGRDLRNDLIPGLAALENRR